MSDGTPLPNRTEETPVTGRDYPEDDPEGRRWSEIWRAVAEEVNANALVSDLSTNRLDYDPEDGTLFIPTDGGDWFLGDGAGWNNLGPVGDITNHTNDTTNPHSVTSDQVGSPSDAEFTSHTGDTTNPHSVTATQADALPTTGGTVTGDTTFTNTTHDSIDTDVAGINQTQRSGRVGDYVYYDWANKGPYIDGADAFADVPPGGTFILAEGTYAVETEGPLHSSIPRHIIGSGAGLPGDSTGALGTQIRSEYVDGPVIQFEGTATDTPSQASIRNVSVDQRATTTHPVIRINNFLRTLICDSNITAGNNPIGVLYEGDAFFARQYRNYIAGWTEKGVSVNGSGYAHEFLQNFVSSGAGTNHTALYCNTNRPIIIGGQYSAVGTGGCAIHLDADGAAKYGAQLIEPGIEKTEVPLRVGGGFTRHSARAYYFVGHMGSTVTSALDLVNSNYGYFVPTYSSASGVAPLVNYGSDSTGNTIEVASHLLQDKTISGSPSIFEAIRVPGATRAGTAMNFPTGSVPIMCEYWDGTQGTGPAWHDTTDWRIASSTTFTL